MLLRILGPVEARARDGEILRLPRRRDRGVLAILLLESGRTVPVDRLCALLWDGELPPSARTAVRSHASRIRTMLARLGVDERGEPLATLLTRGDGYLLRVRPEDVDAHRFRRRLDQAAAATSLAERARLLHEALDLWRGPALQDAVGEPTRERLAAELEELRLYAAEEAAATGLALGRHREVVAELGRLAREHPLRERLVGQYMLALHRAGRTAEAIEVFGRVRARLADELGLDPGPELRRVHEVVLRDDTASLAPAWRPEAVVPAQLPVDVHPFVGRWSELARMDAILDAASADSPGPTVVAVTGAAGIGKTTVAIHWAHRVVDRFPDGQLYVDLHGFDAVRPTAPADAVRWLLDALGVAPERVPPAFDAQVGLYRSLLARRRVLLLLDNARDAEQVRPLLPGGSTAFAVVTSRSDLTSLVATVGAAPVAVSELSTEEACDLLTHRLGGDGIGREPAAVGAVIAACAGLPLALAIVAARARQHRFPLAALADELGGAERRLDALDAGEPASQVRAVLSWSYAALTPPAARLFRLLGLHIGPDISAAAAASLAGRPAVDSRRALAELVRLNLVTEPAPGRYTLHDLLRAYAADVVRAEEPATHRREATLRILDHYTHSALAAARTMRPARVAAAPPAPPFPVEVPADADAARAWFDAERAVLLSVARQAAEEFPEHAWHLVWALDEYLRLRGDWRQRAAIGRLAVRAARRLGDPAMGAYAHRLVASACNPPGRLEEGYEHLRRALRLYERAGDPSGQAHIHENLLLLWDAWDRPGDALAEARRALSMFRQVDDVAGQARALNAIGWCLARLGHPGRALPYCHRALAMLRDLDDSSTLSNTWDSLGYAHHRLGHSAKAIACYRRALALFAARDDRRQEAGTLTRLGDAHQAAGDADAAGDAWRRALKILADLDHPDAEPVRARLRQLG